MTKQQAAQEKSDDKAINELCAEHGFRIGYSIALGVWLIMFEQQPGRIPGVCCSTRGEIARWLQGYNTAKMFEEAAK